MELYSLLNITNFTYCKGGRVLFENVTFDLISGEVVVLMGPNGSGKTTLLRCIAGIPDVHPNIHKGESLSQSYVGHVNALKHNLTVNQNLINQTNLKSQQLEREIEMRGLSSIANRKIQTLSAGQQRQVALTRLALSGARLWLVDEPTTHLDKQATKQFWNMLKTHLNRGGGAVLCSHEPIPIDQAKVVRLHG